MGILRALLWLFVISFFLHPAVAQSPARIQHSFLEVGTKQIETAWLANPTTRYQHFVLGDQYEAQSLVVELRGGKVLQYDLPQHLVFEDRHVRMADLNNDGNDELIVVMSSVLQGASLAVFKVSHEITLLSQTPYIGLPFRWLNPAGIADFDGDGQLEIALVQKPHLTKRLEFWRLEETNLKRVGTIDGFANHRNGSRHQLMSTIFDVNKDGIADLLLPGPNRQSIKAVTMLPTVRVIKEWTLPAPVDGDFTLKSFVSKSTLEMQLQDGANHIITLQQK